MVGEMNRKWLGWKKDGRDVMEQWVGGCKDRLMGGWNKQIKLKLILRCNETLIQALGPGVVHNSLLWRRLSRSVVSSSYSPLGCNPPGSSVHGISQARILQWVAISFSRGSS